MNHSVNTSAAACALAASLAAHALSAQTFGPEQVITTSADSAEVVVAADVDGDGDPDVLWATRDGVIAWHENVGGWQIVGPQHGITTTASGAYSIVAADLDGDQDLDVLAGALGANLSWYENLDGAGSFGPARLIATGTDYTFSVFAADLDGDGDLDALSGRTYYPDHELAWYENLDGLGTFGPERILSTDVAGFRSVCAADLDGDGDQDVLSGSSGKVAWYENDGVGGFGPQKIVSTALLSPTNVRAADLDGDHDLDVLCASMGDDEIVWFENQDGLASFGTKLPVAGGIDGPRSAAAADVDGDADLDVLWAASTGGELAWCANVDGLGGFGPKTILSTTSKYPTWVSAADLDGDGDADALSSSWSDGKIAWYENLVVIPPVALPFGCGVNPDQSLVVVSGAATLGGTLTVGVDNPLGTQHAGSATALGVTTFEPWSFPCGWVVAGIGMAGGGAPGEIFVTPFSQPQTTIFGPAWLAPGFPAPIALPVPTDPAMAGLRLYFQGALLDLWPGANVPLAVTNGLAVQLGT